VAWFGPFFIGSEESRNEEADHFLCPLPLRDRTANCKGCGTRHNNVGRKGLGVLFEDRGRDEAKKNTGNAGQYREL